MKKTDDSQLTEALIKLRGEMPKPRTGLSEDEKDALVQSIGPRTANSILSMRGQVPEARIPFLYSTIDTQSVVDLLANDCKAAIERALEHYAKSHKKSS